MGVPFPSGILYPLALSGALIVCIGLIWLIHNLQNRKPRPQRDVPVTVSSQPERTEVTVLELNLRSRSGDLLRAEITKWNAYAQSSSARVSADSGWPVIMPDGSRVLSLDYDFKLGEEGFRIYRLGALIPEAIIPAVLWLDRHSPDQLHAFLLYAIAHPDTPSSYRNYIREWFRDLLPDTGFAGISEYPSVASKISQALGKRPLSRNDFKEFTPEPEALPFLYEYASPILRCQWFRLTGEKLRSQHSAYLETTAFRFFSRKRLREAQSVLASEVRGEFLLGSSARQKQVVAWLTNKPFAEYHLAMYAASVRKTDTVQFEVPKPDLKAHRKLGFQGKLLALQLAIDTGKNEIAREILDTMKRRQHLKVNVLATRLKFVQGEPSAWDDICDLLRRFPDNLVVINEAAVYAHHFGFEEEAAALFERLRSEFSDEKPVLHNEALFFEATSRKQIEQRWEASKK